jgi:hypothetical protein
MPKERIISITVMGTGSGKPLTIDLFHSFFQELAEKRLGKFHPTPPPFVAPCSDGLLVVYNVVRDGFGLGGEAVSIDKETLEKYPILKYAWEHGNKPMTMKSALLYFGFSSEKS